MVWLFYDGVITREEKVNKAIMLFGTLLPLLTGCCVGHTEYSKETLKRTDLHFIGIPTALGLGMTGSSVPITPEYSLTAAHVAKYMVYRVKAYHPTCDLALIYHKNNEKSYPVLRENNRGENINMYGYSYLTAMPLASSGKTMGDTVTKTWFNKEACTLAYTTAGVIQGMSGGAVYNTSDNTLAGIIEGYTKRVVKPATATQEKEILAKNVSLYVPYTQFSEWLKKEIEG